MGNLAARVLVAVVAVPPLLLAIYQSSPHYVWGIVFVASLIAMYEYLAMGPLDKTDQRVSLGIGALACALLYWLPQSWSPTFLSVIVTLVLPALYYVFRFGNMSTVGDRLNISVVAVLYGGFMLTFLALMKKDSPIGSDLVVLVLLTAWLSDTGGYFAGKFLGKRKLYPAVSPNKTWAGSVGGVAAVLVGTGLFRFFLVPELPWVDLLLLCGIGSVLGQLGDLCESLVKRTRGVKDSGAILPGHGGILDRIDAILFIAPYFYVYLTIRANL